MKTRVLLALVGLATGFVVQTFAQEKHIEAVVTAANAFLATLSTSQLAAVKYDYTLANAEVWSNVPIIIAPGNGLRIWQSDERPARGCSGPRPGGIEHDWLHSFRRNSRRR